MARPAFLVAALLPLLGLLPAPAAASDLATEALAAHCGGKPCPLHPALVRGDVRRTLIGQGAHRTLESWAVVLCNTGPGSAANAAASAACEAALLQPLPAALYADPYELEGAAKAGAGPEARLFGPVDVESIESKAQETLLAIYSPVNLYPSQVTLGGDGSHNCKLQKMHACVCVCVCSAVCTCPC